VTPTEIGGVPFQQEETPSQWELEGYTLRRSYQRKESQQEQIRDALESYVRQGAQ